MKLCNGRVPDFYGAFDKEHLHFLEEIVGKNRDIILEKLYQKK